MQHVAPNNAGMAKHMQYVVLTCCDHLAEALSHNCYVLFTNKEQNMVNHKYILYLMFPLKLFLVSFAVTVSIKSC